MSVNINLDSAVAYIHNTPPSELDGLHQAVAAKCAELGIKPGRRTGAIALKTLPGAPNCNIRGVLRFVESVEAITADDQITDDDKLSDADEGQPGDSSAVLREKADAKEHKKVRLANKERALQAKQNDQNTLLRLYATLQARIAGTGHKVPEPAVPDAPPPLPAPTPDPKPLA